MRAAPNRLVFSDVDETLITGKSMMDFLDFYFTRRHGTRGSLHAARTRQHLAAMLSSGTPRAERNRTYYQAWKGERAAEVAEWGARWLGDRRHEKGFYIERIRAELMRHRADGAVLALVSGSFPAVLDPIAADIGAKHLLCTRPEVRAGILSGRIIGSPVIAEGKRVAVRGLLRRHPHIDPADCHGYGDHISDLPMLTEVGHATVVGGDARLLAALPGARIIHVR
ncbi:HAD-IB family hydrolase [Streptomyces sp. NPDC091267]|uniref:HAD family hydrolase n=1 Tax=Streptomyces sp. NPDC091267 TaxID=3155195 RepID=UPI003422DE2B